MRESRSTVLASLACLAVLSPGVCGQPSWVEAEAPVLTDAVQLTSRETFYKAGEQYFSPDGAWIIFQAVANPGAGEVPEQHYSMYVAPVERDGSGRVTGLGEAIRVSAPGSANTCGWFHPTRPGEILFGTTFEAPGSASGPGYQRAGGRYAWQFPHEMELATAALRVLGAAEDRAPAALFERPGYDAEGSYSADGRYVLYAGVDEARSAEIGRPDADLFVFDTETGEHTALVTEKGYDGGPFFSPDMSWICYRSDRFGDGDLQLFVAELDYGPGGEIRGIRREVQLTANEHVNWAPYFHPSGRFLVYTTSEHGHTNYEVYAIEFDPDKAMDELWKVRITHAEGFDGLPVFSPDGRTMIWCAQRGPVLEGEGRPSSQIWAARFDAGALLRRVEGEARY
jgi:TolB protein